MSSRALRKLRGNDLEVLPVPEDQSDEDEAIHSKSKAKTKANVQNIFDLLGDEDDNCNIDSTDENQTKPVSTAQPETPALNSKKKKKKKKKKNKEPETSETTANADEDEIDASLREVNRILNNGNIGEGETTMAADSSTHACSRALLAVEHRNLNPDNELKRIFGSRVIREEAMRRRGQGRKRQKSCWLATPKDSWPPAGRIGLSMKLKETKASCQYFIFEHSSAYQKVQFQFYDAVESLNPQNIGDILQMQPYHIDAILQLSEVFRMNEDMNMASELIERALYAMEMAFHPLFNLATGTSRLEYKYKENRSMFLAIFKHIASLGQRGCNKTALEFCKLLLSLDPDNDPLCALLIIDYYAIRALDYEFLIRLYDEWEAHRNLSQLPNFAFSLPLAYFLQAEGEECPNADEKLQDSLLMFPGMLVPLLDKCNVQADEAASHTFFKQAEYNQTDALKQLIALYAGRCYVCWKLPNVLEWLERNVKQVIQKIEQADPRIEDYAIKRQSRYKGTPRNIYRHILVSEIPSATATLPQDVASTVLSYDPLPPVESVESYTRPARRNRAQMEGSTVSMFLRSLLPNFNPNEPALDGERGAAGGGEGQQLRQGVGALMDAMRDLLNNIRMVEPPVEDPNQEEGEEEPPLDEWD